MTARVNNAEATQKRPPLPSRSCVADLCRPCCGAGVALGSDYPALAIRSHLPAVVHAEEGGGRALRRSVVRWSAAVRPRCPCREMARTTHFRSH